jgi:hypothetical protein
LQYAKKHNVQNALITWLLLNEDLTGSVYKPAEGLENTITLQTINTSLQQTEKTFRRWRNLLKRIKNVAIQ